MKPVQELAVRLGERTYPIFIGEGLLNQTGRLLRSITTINKIMLVSNPTIFPLYGPQVLKSLQGEGFDTEVGLMPDGEVYKNMDEANKILDRAVDFKLERSSAVLALGGGVVGDLAGFVASIYQRGIDFIQLPTTLLAQVDSSVGGKVAVNHPRGKNLIGSFHQPRLVIVDSLTLDTLEERDYKSGLGEVVKYGVIYDADFFAFMEEWASAIKNRDRTCIERLIFKSCEIKSRIVEEDEKEMGIRAVLNLGHSFGHSLEKLGKYELYRHGEAVVIGTIMAVRLASDLGLVDNSQMQRIITLYKNLDIIPPWPNFESGEIYTGMLNDKKIVNNKLRLVLPQGIGDYVITSDAKKEQIIEAITVARKLADN
ncbi:MAG: 3-dehydroquinate synthase [Syntrophomonas sp.]